MVWQGREGVSILLDKAGVICFEEVSMISAQQICIFDERCKQVHSTTGNSAKRMERRATGEGHFGNREVISFGDLSQLQPVKGTSIQTGAAAEEGTADQQRPRAPPQSAVAASEAVRGLVGRALWTSFNACIQLTQQHRYAQDIEVRASRVTTEIL